MAIKSRNNVQKILINMEDKRDYVLSNIEIEDKYVKSVVNLFDNLLDIMEVTYDSIINHKKLDRRTYINKLNKLSEIIDNTLDDLVLEDDTDE